MRTLRKQLTPPLPHTPFGHCTATHSWHPFRGPCWFVWPTVGLSLAVSFMSAPRHDSQAAPSETGERVQRVLGCHCNKWAARRPLIALLHGVEEGWVCCKAATIKMASPQAGVVRRKRNSVKISAAKPARPGISLIKPSASMWLHLSRCMELQLFELPCTSFIHLMSYENKVGIFYCQNANVSELISHGHTRMLIRPLHSLFQHLAEGATCIWTASNIWIQFRLCVWRSLVRPAALSWWSSCATGFIYRVFAAKTGRRITWKMKIEVGFFDWPGGNSSRAERCADAAHDWLLIQQKDETKGQDLSLAVWIYRGILARYEIWMPQNILKFCSKKTTTKNCG